MADSIDIKLVFSSLANTLKHFLGDADVNKAQEKEIQDTIKQLNDFEGSINDLIDARIAAAKGAGSSSDSSDLGERVTALENGLAELGHIFTGDQGAEQPPADVNDQTQTGGQADDSRSAGADTISGGNGTDSVTADANPPAGQPAAEVPGNPQPVAPGTDAKVPAPEPEAPAE